MSLFGDELRRLRRAAGLSQEVLATRAGLSPEAVSLLERGRRSPRMTTMRLLADAMALPESERAAMFGSAQPTEPTAPALPSFLDALIDRETELTELAELADRSDVGLITVVGPAGVGKTRIAVEYARQHARRYPDGVHWLPIGPLAEADTVVPALAGALGVRGTAHPGVADVVDQFRRQSALLIIDNAEHQQATCLEICQSLLTEAPSVMIIVTSRHLIGASGETAFTVSPLRTPEEGATEANLATVPASRLFLVRAGLGTPTARDREAVVRICQRVDGLPLALELAAARTNVLTVGELADTLDSQLAILQTAEPGGSRQLVDAMVSWSYSSLSEREKLIFERLSVFSSAFARDAVTAVAGADLTELDVVDVLSSLVSKSLVSRHDDGAPQARFRLLQLIREYAAARFAERPDADLTRQRHAEYFCRLVEAAAPHLSGHDQHDWLPTVDRELSNLRQAIGWAIANQPELALRMVAAVGQWCYLRGRYSDGRSWAEDALAAAPDAPPHLQAPVRQLAATVAFLQCDYAEASRLVESALELARRTGDEAGITWAIARSGSIDRELGDYTRAEARHREAMALAERAGDEHALVNQLNFLCFVTWISGRVDEAEPLGREALGRMRELGDGEGVIWALINLGAIARYRGDLAGAALLLGQCLDLCDELSFPEGIGWASDQLAGVTRLQQDSQRALGLARASLAEHEAVGDLWRAASVHDELAAIAIEFGDAAEATRQLSAADRLRVMIGAPIPAVERPAREQTVRAARAALGPAYELVELTAGLQRQR